MVSLLQLFYFSIDGVTRHAVSLHSEILRVWCIMLVIFVFQYFNLQVFKKKKMSCPKIGGNQFNKIIQILYQLVCVNFLQRGQKHTTEHRSLKLYNIPLHVHSM